MQEESGIFPFLIQMPSSRRGTEDRELEEDWKGIRALTFGVNKVLFHYKTFILMFPLLSVQLYKLELV